MKTRNLTQMILAILFATFGAHEKAQAQLNVYGIYAWAYPGPYFCNGTKFELSGLAAENTTDTIIYMQKIALGIKNNSNALDSVFLLRGNSQVLVQGIPSSNNSFIFNAQIQPNSTENFYLVVKSKLSKQGIFEIEVGTVTYQINGRSVNNTKATYTTSAVVNNCSPKVEISSFNRKFFCEKDRISAYGNLRSWWGEIDSVEWLVNGKLVRKESFKEYGSEINSDYFKLTAPATKLKIRMIDDLGRIGEDSIVLEVRKNPRLKMKISSTEVCKGGYATVSIDTPGFSKWSWDLGNPVKKEKTEVYFSTPGIHSFSAIGNNECWIDTSFFIHELPKQEKLKISSYDSTLWTNQNAAVIKWLYNDVVFDSSKQIITRKQSGFYRVHAKNEFGCESISDLFKFDYIAPKDPIPPKKEKVFPKIIWVNVEAHINYAIVTAKLSSKGELASYWAFFGDGRISPENLFYDTGLRTITLVLNDLFADSKQSVFFHLKNTNGHDSLLSLFQTLPNRVPITKTLKITQVDDSTLLFQGKYYANGSSPVRYYFKYSEDLRFDVQTPILFSMNDSDVVYSLVKVNPGATYNIRLVCENKIGEKEGNILTFKTKSKPAGITKLTFQSQESKVYPNPFRNQLTIESERGDDLVFIDIQGAIVHKISLQNDREQINLEFLPTGMYFLQIYESNQLIGYQKVVKQ